MSVFVSWLDLLIFPPMLFLGLAAIASEYDDINVNLCQSYNIKPPADSEEIGVKNLSIFRLCV